MKSRCIRQSLLVLAVTGLSAVPDCVLGAEVAANPQIAFSLTTTHHANGARSAEAHRSGSLITCREISEVDDLETEVESEAPARKLVVEITRGSFERLLLNSDAMSVRNRFNQRLHARLAAVDRAAKLSGPQKSKLRLAGRGDIKHFFDRTAAIEAKFGKFDNINEFDDFEKWVRDLSHEILSLQPGLSAGPFDDESLFAKTLKTTLSPEQAAELARARSRLVDSPASLALSDKCWDVLGLRLEKAEPLSLAAFRNKYRGGMLVVDVRTKGDAGMRGIRKGDILVGVDHWETVRNEDIKFIVNQDYGREPRTFYVVRGHEVLTGKLPFPDLQK